MIPPASYAQFFTVSQIASALGTSRQAAQGLLAGIEPDGQRVVKANVLCAWTYATLPARLKDLLEKEARRQGFRDALALLCRPFQPWEPAVPLAEVSQAALDRAVKLQRALAPMLQRKDDLTLSQSQFKQEGVAEYRGVFGYSISTRHWDSLFKRTLKRDAGAENWSRLDIYLDRNPARKTNCQPALSCSEARDFEPLTDVMATFRNPAAPSDEEKTYLWLRVVEFYEAGLAAGKPPKKFKRALIRALSKIAPFLPAGANALRVKFNRKFAAWIENHRSVAALSDQRKTKSGNWRAPELKKEDRDQIIAHAALNCGGRVSQAWRELFEDERLSPDLAGCFLSNPASKSYVPQRIREAAKYDVALLKDIHHGPRQHKLNGAHLSRDWTGVAAGDFHQSDDCTLPIYYYVPDGQGWFTLLRGQFLPMIDLRSTCILDYALQSERNYNARTIRTLITKVCDKYGLPRKGFYFEMGIWKTSRLLAGDPDATPFSFGEVERGLRDLGVRFVYSKLPRSKPVERLLGAFQDMLEGDPGYVGRDEMNEKFERVQKLKLEVERRKIHPAGHFYNAEQWFARLDELCARYNATPQEGKMTMGLSPQEAFEQYQDPADPPIKLDARCRYLLSHHKRPVKVTSNGITLRFGKQAFTYRNEITGRLIGQTVLAWWNPETPDILAVTDMNRENPVCLPLSHDVPAMDAPPEILAREMALIEAHQSYAKVRYSDLKQRFSTPFRRNVVDAPTAELGQTIERNQDLLRAEQKEEKSRIAAGQKLCRALNMPTPFHALQRPETVAALARLKELMETEEPAQ